MRTVFETRHLFKRSILDIRELHRNKDSTIQITAHGPVTNAYVGLSEISWSFTLAQQSMAYLDFNYYATAFIGSVWRSNEDERERARDWGGTVI